jgi:hypothetical protein
MALERVILLVADSLICEERPDEALLIEMHHGVVVLSIFVMLLFKICVVIVTCL